MFKSVAATLPAQDIERAKSFYADKLGLKPVEENEEGATYEVGGQRFLLFPSTGKASGDHTQLGLDVDDLRASVKALRENGVQFETYDMPNFKSDEDGIVSMGTEEGAWFKDSEGNLIAVSQQRS